MAGQPQILECHKIFHKNLQDHAVLIKPKKSTSSRSGGLAKLILRNISTIVIYIDLTNDRIDIKDIWSATIACNQCVQVWYKLKDMMFSLLAQLVCSRYTMLRTCRLFVARIYSNSWSWRREGKFLAYLPCKEVDCHHQKCCSYGNDHSESIQRRGLIQSKDSFKSNMQICNIGNSIHPQKTSKVKGPLKRKRGKTEKRISREDLEPFFSGSMMEAASCLGVSRSTIKRKCRQLGISEWPSSKGNKRNKRNKNVPTSANEPKSTPTHLRVISSKQNNSSNKRKSYQTSLIEQQSLPITTIFSNNYSYKKLTEESSRNYRFLMPTQLKIVGQQSEQIINLTIKTVYRGDMIRFKFPIETSVMELKKEVAVRLRLKLGTFKLKYLDDDNEWALLSWDSDWQECVWISRSSQRNNVVRLFVQDV